ncbi:MAG: winged helix DNA-binding domain-containing protein, partial [Acidimicrobiales bacterium]|nr:winged helix DNA-binding domain-containing protein [Acidimicrobiales bacterium]
MRTRRITIAERRARLARRHRLLPSTRTDDVAEIADSLVALHSSDPASVYLSAMARMRHPSVTTVESALYETRSVVRFHAMRRTLWVATPEVARLAHASSTTKLLAPEHRRFVALLAANGIADDGDAWIASA